jgi:hypothetical protein
VLALSLGALSACGSYGGNTSPCGGSYGNSTATCGQYTPAPQPEPPVPQEYTNISFDDPLTANINGWFEGNGCSFLSDGYHVTGDVSCFAPTRTPDDADVVVQARQVDGSLQQGYGLVTRASFDSSGHFTGYSFIIDGLGHWAVFKDDSGASGKLIDFTPSTAIHAGLNASNLLEVRMRGPDFYFFANGTLLSHVSNWAFSAGKSGVTGSSNSDVIFSDFQIRAASFAPPQPATPAATATPQGFTVLRDPLTATTHSHGWFTGQFCFFRSDGYHINDGTCGAPTRVPNDATASVQARQISGPMLVGYGLIVRAHQVGNEVTGYYFAIASAGAWTFIRLDAGSSTPLIPFTDSSAIHMGLNEMNTLMVQAQGSHFTLFVNGVQVGEADDATYASGDVALSVPAPIEVVYTNFLLTSPQPISCTSGCASMPPVVYAHPALNVAPVLTIVARLVDNAWHDWTP